MSLAPANPARPAATHVALVAGARTLAEQTGLIRHLMIGLLDEPLPLTLVAPPGADLSNLPCPPASFVPFQATRLPLLATRLARPVCRQLLDLKVTLLHALDTDDLPAARLLAAGTGLEFVVTVSSLDVDYEVTRGRCRGLLAGSQPIYEAILQRHITTPQRLHLVRPGAYQARHSQLTGPTQRLSSVLVCGKYAGLPSFETVLEALALVRGQRSDCAFFVVDQEGIDERLRRQARRLNLMADLTFVDRGGQEQLEDIFRWADVLVSPAASGRIDLELLSAMAAGVPVAAEGAGANDFLIPDETALTFVPGDARQLADRIIRLLDDRALARSLAETALTRLRECHSPSRMVSQLAGIYRSLTQPAPATA